MMIHELLMNKRTNGQTIKSGEFSEEQTCAGIDMGLIWVACLSVTSLTFTLYILYVIEFLQDLHSAGYIDRDGHSHVMAMPPKPRPIVLRRTANLEVFTIHLEL